MISEQERNKREKIINFARGNVRFDGITLSKEIEEINTKFINGEIEIEEHTTMAIAQMKKEFEIRKSLK